MDGWDKIWNFEFTLNRFWDLEHTMLMGEKSSSLLEAQALKFLHECILSAKWRQSKHT